VITEGHENLLMVSLENQFTNQEFESNLIYNIMIQFQEEISQLKFFNFKNGKKGCLNELVFLRGKC
jgi:hypothetical protein